MSYRPVTDIWMLARPKVKYYGAYPNGFMERAKILLGYGPNDNVLHVCGGHARNYPNKAVMGDTYTLDLDPATKPDFLMDAREPLPLCGANQWDAVLCDPPYTTEDAKHYVPDPLVMPTANTLLRNSLEVVKLGGRIGILHYLLPQPPKVGAKFLACVGIVVGFNNRMRCFSVFERI